LLTSKPLVYVSGQQFSIAIYHFVNFICKKIIKETICKALTDCDFHEFSFV